MEPFFEETHQTTSRGGDVCIKDDHNAMGPQVSRSSRDIPGHYIATESMCPIQPVHTT